LKQDHLDIAQWLYSVEEYRCHLAYFISSAPEYSDEVSAWVLSEANRRELEDSFADLPEPKSRPSLEVKEYPYGVKYCRTLNTWSYPSFAVFSAYMEAGVVLK
jgi:hypothetical protein